jgi:hypothetical protein
LTNGQEAPASIDGVTISALPGAHLGPTIFDSSSPGPNVGGPDPDLLVNTGNILILQSQDNPTQTVPGIFDVPNDEADGGTFVFTFDPTQVLSIDLVDINGNGAVDVMLQDVGGWQRIWSVPMMWTFDVSVSGPDGFKTLDLTDLNPQEGEIAGIFATVTLDSALFDASAVNYMEVRMSGSAGVDNLALAPEPTTLALLGLLARAVPSPFPVV